MIFGKIRIKSKLINIVASSTFAMYLFHHQPVILFKIIKPTTLYIDTLCEDTLVKFSVLAVFTLVIIIVTIVVDQMIRPIVMWLESSVSDAVIKVSKTYQLTFGTENKLIN